MPERIPQSIAKRVVLRAISSTDHITPATGKTIAITISKNGGSFANPAAGATNATEISSGFYYFDLGTGDTGTQGPLAWRAAGTGIDDLGDVYEVVNATNAGFTGLPNVAAGSNGGVPLVGTQVPNATAGAAGGLLISGSNSGTTTLGALTVSGALTATGGIVGDITGNLSGSVGSVAVGGIAATSFASGAIDAASLATDAANEIRDAVFAKTLSELTGDPGATPTFADAVMLQHMALRNKRETDSSLGTDKLYNSAGTAILSATVADTGTVFTKAKYA